MRASSFTDRRKKCIRLAINLIDIWLVAKKKETSINAVVPMKLSSKKVDGKSMHPFIIIMLTAAAVTDVCIPVHVINATH